MPKENSKKSKTKEKTKPPVSTDGFEKKEGSEVATAEIEPRPPKEQETPQGPSEETGTPQTENQASPPASDGSTSQEANESSDTPPSKGEQKPESEGEKFSFPTRVRCPRCRSLQTRATSTQGQIQYRECQMPVCRKRFSVRGEPV